MSIEQPATRMLLFGTLFVGASALPAGNLIAGLLAGVGGNWVAEAFGGVIGAGPPPGVALTRAFARAVQSASLELRTQYGVERVRHDGADAFELLRQSARSITTVAAPAGVADLTTVQRSLGDALSQVLHDFPDAQVRLLRERLLPATARAFHEELAREPEAWRLYQGWLLEYLVTHSAAIHAALVAHPAAQAALADPAALEARLDEFAGQLEALLAKLRDELRTAAGVQVEVDQSEQEGGTSYGAFNQFGVDQPVAPPPGNLRVDQSKLKDGINYGAFNQFGKTPPAEDAESS